MTTKDIKTLNDFYEFGDIFYRRVHVLRSIWQNSNETADRMAKAYRLWLVAANRVLKISQEITRIESKQSARIIKGFPIGGIISKQTT